MLPTTQPDCPPELVQLIGAIEHYATSTETSPLEEQSILSLSSKVEPHLVQQYLREATGFAVLAAAQFQARKLDDQTKTFDRQIQRYDTGLAEKVLIEREYRVKSFGCGDGYAPLVKPIAARAGDTVTLSQAGVAVNGKLLQNSKQYPKDGIGRPMPMVPFGTYAVLPGTVWVISSYNRFSFDSRYFGPVNLDEKVRYAKLFWLF